MIVDFDAYDTAMPVDLQVKKHHCAEAEAVKFANVLYWRWWFHSAIARYAAVVNGGFT